MIKCCISVFDWNNVSILLEASFNGIRFSTSRNAITHLIQSSGNPSLKIANCQDYLEPDAGLSGSMRNSNLIHSDLSASVPSTLSIFFTMETKEIEGRGALSHRRRQRGGIFGKLTHVHCLDQNSSTEV
jgi:hypothetical protein